MCFVVGVAGIRDARRCSGRRTDAHTGVALGDGVAQDSHFHWQVRASQHDLMQACPVAAMGFRAIEAAEAWVAHFGGEVGSMLGRAALQCHWQSQYCKAPAEVGVEQERQHRQAVAAHEVVVRCLVGHSMTLV